MRIIFSVMILLVASSAFGQSQQKISNTAQIEFKKSDTNLNVIYQKILARYKGDRIFVDNLKSAQRQWIKYRDAQVKVKYPTYGEGDGTIVPMCQYYYLQGLTQSRIVELETWLNGADEGDVCAGSIKY